mmetsp:Transcript_6097/g.15501  ORF Transcript_6097/g.15501 Transcript_6097/m.15501 type:complete len:343 (-) Transcript_6097:682-1710(-)
MWMPRAATSVATSTGTFPPLNSLTAASRSPWVRFPWRMPTLTLCFFRNRCTNLAFRIVFTKTSTLGAWRSPSSRAADWTWWMYLSTFFPFLCSAHTWTTCRMLLLRLMLLGRPPASPRGSARDAFDLALVATQLLPSLPNLLSLSRSMRTTEPSLSQNSHLDEMSSVKVALNRKVFKPLRRARRMLPPLSSCSCSCGCGCGGTPSPFPSGPCPPVHPPLSSSWIFCSWSANPIWNILSASSITTKPMRDKSTWSWSMRSHSLPGVAMVTSCLDLSMASCFSLRTPPVTANPLCLVSRFSSRQTASTCFASSRVGTSTSARGDEDEDDEASPWPCACLPVANA